MKLCMYQIYQDSLKNIDFSFYGYDINISNILEAWVNQAIKN